jgi:archaellum component FlaC
MLKHATKTQEKMDDLDSSLEKSARKLQSLRNNHIKMIENFLLWVDNEASEGSNAEISEASDLIERFEENLAALRDLYDL